MTPDQAARTTPALDPRARRIADAIDNRVLWIARHWLAAVVAYGTIMLGLALTAPVLRALGLDAGADLLYFSYQFTCHQQPERSFHLFGEPIAFCQRDAAIVGGAVLVAGIFAVIRQVSEPRPIRFGWVVALALPMALDGFTQLAGLRESTWQLRVITGLLFSAAGGWYVLPLLATGFAKIERDMTARPAEAGATISAGAARA